jgi:hypothetical protein
MRGIELQYPYYRRSLNSMYESFNKCLALACRHAAPAAVLDKLFRIEKAASAELRRMYGAD